MKASALNVELKGVDKARRTVCQPCPYILPSNITPSSLSSLPKFYSILLGTSILLPVIPISPNIHPMLSDAVG